MGWEGKQNKDKFGTYGLVTGETHNDTITVAYTPHSESDYTSSNEKSQREK